MIYIKNKLAKKLSNDKTKAKKKLISKLRKSGDFGELINLLDYFYIFSSRRGLFKKNCLEPSMSKQEFLEKILIDMVIGLIGKMEALGEPHGTIKRCHLFVEIYKDEDGYFELDFGVVV